MEISTVSFTSVSHKSMICDVDERLVFAALWAKHGRVVNVFVCGLLFKHSRSHKRRDTVIKKRGSHWASTGQKWKGRINSHKREMLFKRGHLEERHCRWMMSLSQYGGVWICRFPPHLDSEATLTQGKVCSNVSQHDWGYIQSSLEVVNKDNFPVLQIFAYLYEWHS